MPEPPFERLIAVHRGAARRDSRYALVLIAAGLIVLALGAFGVLPWLAAVIVGVVTIAVAVFPRDAGLEREELAADLELLRGAWSEAGSTGTMSSADRDAIAGILDRFFDRP